MVTWIGDLSYSKVPSEKEQKITYCPVCGSDFVQIYYEGVPSIVPPDRHYEGLIDSDDHWKTVLTGQWIENEDNRFDYAPTRDLNEILKSIVLAD